jgi:hypothetical protein
MSRKDAAPRSEAEKIKFLDEHFRFEVRELIACVYFYITTQVHKVGKNLNVEIFMVNTALDHAFLHARNLSEFFYDGNDPDNYAHAIAFSPKWGPRRKPKLVHSFERRVNPEVVHLCWARLSSPEADRMWNVEEVAVPILTEVLNFINSLDDSYITENTGMLKLETLDVIKHIKTVKVPPPRKKVRDLFAIMERGGHVPGYEPEL